MRIERLELARYGCFTDVTLELGAPGLHVVVGPNEAGKSTSRAAVTDLLFGFPVRTPQAHIHATADLCLGATLATERDAFTVERHKRKPHLRAPGGEPLEAELVEGSVSRDLYEALFAMGHEELRAGAAEILRTRGDIGRILFGVTAGRAGAAALLDQLQAEAEELFKPRAQKRGLMASLAAHNDARSRVAAAVVPPATWSRAADELREIEEAIAARQAERSACNEELEEHRTLRATAPLLSRRAAAIEERTQLAAAYLSPEARDRIRAALLAASESERTERSAQHDLERIEASAPPPNVDGVLALEGEITSLQELIGEYRNDVRDLPRLEERVAVAEAELNNASRRCGSTPTDGTAHVPPAAVQAEALLLATAMEESQRELSRAASARAEAESAAQLANRGLAACPSTLATDDLRTALCTLQMTVTEVEQRRQRAEEATVALKDQQEMRDALVGASSIPTADDLRVARASRDASWRALRASWASGESLDSAAADTFDRYVAAADSLADRRQADGETAGRLAALEEAVTLAAANQDDAQATLTKAEVAQQAAATSVRDALVSLGKPASDHADVSDLIVAAETAISDAAASAAELARLAMAAESCDMALSEALANEADAASALAAVEQRWEAACGALGISAPLSPTAIRAHLDALKDLVQATEDVSRARAGLALVRVRVDSFEATSSSLAARIDPAVRSESAEEMAGELARRLREAVDQRAVAATTAAREHELRETLSGAATRRNASLATMADIATSIGVELDALEPAVEVSVRRDELDSEIAAVEKLILDSAGGATVDAVVRLADGRVSAPAAELDAALMSASTRLADLDRELDALHVRRGELKQTLAAWRGADDAARAAAEMHEVAAVVGETATRYVRLKIAHEVLRREVDRNREEHQGPVIRRAAQHLSALTNRRYVDILDAIDDGAVLDVRRYDGEVVGVERLSEGTRDQLWLALRLAALEHWCLDREPLPLVLDDVCMTFDDERTGAALQLLAKLSDTVQVLFFTHHESVAATAARVVPDARVHVHRLERFNPPMPVTPSTGTRRAPLSRPAPSPPPRADHQTAPPHQPPRRSSA